MIAINKDHSCDLPQASIQPEKSFLSLWLTGAQKILNSILVSVRNRKATQHLLNATDGELADIGLTRDDLYLIKNAGLFDDPSRELSRRARIRNHRY